MTFAPPIRLATATLMASALFLTGCQSSPDDVPSPVETDSERRSPSPAATETTSAYTDPSKADTYCEAIADLITLNDEATARPDTDAVGPGPDTEAIEQMGIRLDLLVSGTARIGQLAPDDAAAHDWNAVSHDFELASDLFKSSGGQAANTDFILLLAKATTTANTAYEQQAEAVEDECGIDITTLIAEEERG